LANLQSLLEELHDDPVALDYVLYPNAYKLLPFQREILRTIDDPKLAFGYAEAARGLSKTYLIGGRWVGQACAKIPGYKVVFSGPSFRQSQAPFRYLVDLIEENPPMKSLLKKEPTMGNVRWEMQFKNGSKVVALPASAEKLHGERANVIVFEEFFAYPEELHNRTVKPMLAVQSNRKYANKAIYITSADFQFRWAYKRRGDIQRAAESGDSRYAFMSYDINAMPPPEEGGFYSADQLEDDRRSMPPELFEQQYFNKWLSDAGTFYSLAMLANTELRQTQVELIGQPTNTYVMGIDVARSLRGNGDDSGIGIWRLGENDALVNLQGYNDITMESLGDEVLRYLDLFPTTSRIVLDFGGGGVSVRDHLYKHGVVDIDEPDPSVPGRRLIQKFPNTAEVITYAHYQFKGAAERKIIQLPVIPEDGHSDKERVIQNVETAIHQAANIEATPLASGHMKFEVPGKQKKDLAYAVVYGYWGCQQLKERQREEAVVIIPSDVADLFDPLASIFG
jgi:hypothetical protein